MNTRRLAQGQERIASERRRFAFLVLAARVFYRSIELAGLDVSLQPAIPRRPVELHEPCPELSKPLGGEGFDLSFDVFDVAPVSNLAIQVYLLKSNSRETRPDMPDFRCVY